jgi:hypothetical protein
MNNLTKHLPVLLAGVLFILMSQAHAQPANLILQDTTIATVATFTATNSITAGPNFTIAGTGNAAFVTGGFIYLRSGVVIVQGGALRTIRDSITVGVQPPETPLPIEFALRQNYPNPFNPVTTISFDLPGASHVVLTMYNVLGQEVATAANETLPAGRYTRTFDAGELASGVYFYRLVAGQYTQTKRMMVLK